MENLQARKYNSSLTSYVNFTIKDPASFIYGQYDHINNASLKRSEAYIIFTSYTNKSNNVSTLRTYDYYTYNLL